MKSEVRNSNFETMFEMSKIRMFQTDKIMSFGNLVIWILDLFRASKFGFRILN